MKAVVTVLGKDAVGILASVSSVCAKLNINVTDVSQTILSDLFAMLMAVDMGGSTATIASFSAELKALCEPMGLVTHVVHEDVFNTMHHV